MVFNDKKPYEKFYGPRFISVAISNLQSTKEYIENMEHCGFILRILFTHECSYNDFFLMRVSTSIKKKSL